MKAGFLLAALACSLVAVVSFLAAAGNPHRDLANFYLEALSWIFAGTAVVMWGGLFVVSTRCDERA